MLRVTRPPISPTVKWRNSTSVTWWVDARRRSNGNACAGLSSRNAREHCCSFWILWAGDGTSASFTIAITARTSDESLPRLKSRKPTTRHSKAFLPHSDMSTRWKTATRRIGDFSNPSADKQTIIHEDSFGSGWSATTGYVWWPCRANGHLQKSRPRTCAGWNFEPGRRRAGGPHRTRRRKQGRIRLSFGTL